MNSSRKIVESPMLSSRRPLFPMRVSHLLKACENSKNLIVGVYQITEQRFLCGSDSLKELIGAGYCKLLREGWEMWFNRIDPNEVFWISNKIRDFLKKPFESDLLSLKYHFQDCQGKRLCLKHEMQHHKLDAQLLMTNYFYDLTEMETIENYFNAQTHKPEDTQDLSEELCISSREKEVLRLIANGFSSKEIAHMLFISDHTAISHRKNLIEKFKVKNTAHLIKRASEVIPLF